MKRNRIISTITALTLTLGLAGCGDAEPAEPSDILTPPTPVYDAMLISKNVKSQSGITGKEADEAFISAQYDFAAELFRNSFSGEESTLVSPLSVMLALSMTANGADGGTLTEMQEVLGDGMEIDELNKYLYTYVKSLESGREESVKMSIANSIWYRDTDELAVREDFLQKNADYYGASIFKAPFDSDTAYAINNWVTDNTDGMIDRIVDDIGSDTMMYLINAIAFDAEWEDIYESYQINEMPFTDINGIVQTVEMMSSSEDVYLYDGRAKGFMKYYKGGRYAFAALLPNEDIGIEEYISSLTGGALAEALTPSYDYIVYADMPKFCFDYDIRLKEVLKDMGMPSAFEGADLSRMAEMDLYISDVLHKTFIEVGEHGTKAGAVTSVEINATGALIEKECVEITLDRPFVFAIVDTETNLPIFIGATLSVE